MAIDNSIYFRQQAPDVLGNVSQGLSMRDMIDTRNQKMKLQKNEEAKKQAYAAGVVQNPDGTSSFDYGKTISELAGTGNAEDAMKLNSEKMTNDAANQKLKIEKFNQQVGFFDRALPGVKDQTSYLQAMEQAKSLGLDTSTMPPMWGPDAKQKLEFYAGQAYTQKDRLEQQNKDRDYNLKLREFTAKRDADAKTGDKLPIDQKKFVETLATKNAGKFAIKNQIEAVMNTWDQLPDDQKLAQGRSLLKTLNSTEGADAIGVEEANRLGSKLEFALGNFTNSNSTQFGRDLEGFKTQALAAAKNIGTAVEANQAEIDRNLGRKPKTKSGPEVGTVENGYFFKGGDPADKNSWEKI